MTHAGGEYLLWRDMVAVRRVWRDERNELRADVVVIGVQYAFACVGGIMVEWYRNGETRVRSVVGE